MTSIRFGNMFFKRIFIILFWLTESPQQIWLTSPVIETNFKNCQFGVVQTNLALFFDFYENKHFKSFECF